MTPERYDTVPFLTDPQSPHLEQADYTHRAVTSQHFCGDGGAASRPTVPPTARMRAVREDLLDAGADAKRTAALLSDARSALRRLDTLMAQALAQEDDVAADVAEVRSGLERVVVHLTRRQASEHRQAKAATRRR